MCAACAAEYADPADRRFHAQPNACAVCGPSLALVAPGTRLDDCSFADRDSLSVLRKARSLLRAGNILAVKGLGGFLLACDAGNDAAVAELRRRKRRSDKPFALMVRDLASIQTICKVSPLDEAALLSVRRPVVVLPRAARASVSSEVAPGNDTLGVMLPYTPLHYLLFSDSPDAPSEFPALVMTSGNLSEEPIVDLRTQEALRQLDGVADWFLLHNRDIWTRVDDSVVRAFQGCERVLRRSRGFVPQTIDLGIGAGRGAGLWRRVEEHLLPHQGPLRHPEPAHRRSGKLRDDGVFRGNAGPFATQLSRLEPRAVALRSAPWLLEHAAARCHRASSRS